MKHDILSIKGCKTDVYSLNTVVVGTGAAGFNAADRLWNYGQTDIAIVTEGINMGTSRNTGSDKQTYYKLTLSGDGSDSVFETARTLFDGGAMHGDLALCEAALSAQSFYKLAEIGVPFPHNGFGEYVGYKTDHDPRRRATSAGPLTSKFMTEKLEIQVKNKKIKIFDKHKVIGVIVEKGKCRGLIALNKANCENPDKRFVLFNCTNVIFATGGPAGLYTCSVFPTSQTGSSGVAFEAGVRGRNLTEWQYGIASVKFRWNLSGTYQQVIPRYVSTDKDGKDPREFLDEYYENPTAMLDGIFLKGYQWPFDPRKIENFASSLIDILVYNETQIKGRRVWLDFTQNPSALKADFGNLGEEAYAYLKNSGALLPTPIERLAHMNKPAIDLYAAHNIDLTREMLEIAVCAQHNNGGLAVNRWWETNVAHFFVAGEAAGTHGVYRPGGSALNSGQVGSTRAAMYIAHRYTDAPPSAEDFLKVAEKTVFEKMDTAERFLSCKSGKTVGEIRAELGDRMSKYAAHIRSSEGVKRVISEAKAELFGIADNTVLKNAYELPQAFENMDLLTAQYVYASAMENYIEEGGKSRGSYLIYDKDGVLPADGIPENLRFTLDDGRLTKKVQEVGLRGGECEYIWDDVRPIPSDDDWFENVWNDYMNDKIVK